MGARRVDRGDGRSVRGAGDPDRLGQRLALQRDGRPRDRPDPGRRLRRPARGRADGARRLARGGRRPPRRRVAGRARGLRVPGAVRRGLRPPGGPRPRGRGGARRVPLARRGALLAGPRRLAGRARSRAREGRAPLRDRRRGDAAGRPARLVRRGRRPGGARLRARRRRPARGRPDPQARHRRRHRPARPRRSTSCGRPTADVRRLRHPLRRARRCPSQLLRPLRAAASRPGGGRDRGLRPRPADRAPRHGARGAGVRRGEAAGAAGAGRDRAHPLLDHRLERVGERAAARPPRPRRGRSRSATTAT